MTVNTGPIPAMEANPEMDFPKSHKISGPDGL